MSATRRGAVRHPDDFYETPDWATRAIVEAIGAPNFGLALDAGCGTGAILRELAANGIEGRGIEKDAARAREARKWTGCSRVTVGDFLDPASHPQEQVASVVMNPPYREASEFIRTALAMDMVDRGWANPEEYTSAMVPYTPFRPSVVALLRQGFFGSCRTRRDLIEQGSGLYAIYNLTKRPSFTGDNRTDACDYCWGVWWKGWLGAVKTHWIWLD